MSAGLITGFVIGGALLIILGGLSIWWAIKVYKNKRYSQDKSIYLSFWGSYGHWFLWPFAFVFLVIGIAFSFASLMVDDEE